MITPYGTSSFLAELFPIHAMAKLISFLVHMWVFSISLLFSWLRLTAAISQVILLVKVSKTCLRAYCLARFEDVKSLSADLIGELVYCCFEDAHLTALKMVQWSNSLILLRWYLCFADFIVRLKINFAATQAFSSYKLIIPAALSNTQYLFFCFNIWATSQHFSSHQSFPPPEFLVRDIFNSRA